MQRPGALRWPSVGRAIRLGLERCRVCSSATENTSRICSTCQAVIDAGERDRLLERGAAHMLGRFPILAKDEQGFRRVLEQSQARFFA